MVLEEIARHPKVSYEKVRLLRVGERKFVQLCWIDDEDATMHICAATHICDNNPLKVPL